MILKGGQPDRQEKILSWTPTIEEFFLAGFESSTWSTNAMRQPSDMGS